MLLVVNERNRDLFCQERLDWMILEVPSTCSSVIPRFCDKGFPLLFFSCNMTWREAVNKWDACFILLHSYGRGKPKPFIWEHKAHLLKYFHILSCFLCFGIHMPLFAFWLSIGIIEFILHSNDNADHLHLEAFFITFKVRSSERKAHLGK